MIQFRRCKGTTMPLIIAVLDTVMTTRLWASAKFTVALILILAARPSTGQDTVNALSTTNGGQGPFANAWKVPPTLTDNLLAMK